ncbi:hypothetical protein JANAI62_14050 [Jannaschia pagri]|uniref:DUF1440 domain-containing protein n=1 Tax=Jannaschia pagri TaxID=2829797 RepID=A0ABQ4NL03_9RHOB|nr:MULTISPECIES: hypothetical protein [unclassified Jannaschia]GIT90951.1 hypothetical protein JANAI61_14090 [Jannaschia sp. AI_61]GIT94782.1 hypothetical protein JANAI62_14050 [Jannaschia sp. AI_62]
MTHSTKHTAWTLLIAGALATIAFDLFGQGLSPLFGFAKLAPVGLATGTVKSVFGVAPKGIGDVVHILTGMIAYPLGYFLVARPLAAKFTPWLHWSLVSVAYGVGLWVFALYFVAHLIAGNAPFLGFSGITWVALWGHVLFAVVAAAVIERNLPRTVQTTPALA